ncbi:hypothetical protein EUGRSUZ_A00630 [Eucalyptus grandis]|uniref:Uncharacterized protein n=2 Tax=Eucalyptus grandis TaxID=71139 RepID=A0ACC3M0V5_EUCGR|nr:hypothetical protein EUGRSUZ_A00630 [Eucalyptus grandis]
MREPLLDHETSSPQPSSPLHLTKYLYSGHFLARWGARMWDFSVALYLINIWPDSLLLAAVYGVWVDRLSYVKVLQLWLVTQNFSFIFAGGTVLGLLAYPDLKSTSVQAFVLLILLTNVSGAVGVLSTLAGTILIEREWVVVMSEGQAPILLTRMNSVIRLIDLICKFTISVWPEYWLFMSVYQGIPALAERNRQRTQKPFPAELTESLSVPDDDHPANAEKSRKRSLGEKIANLPLVSAWRVYFEQEVVLPGIVLALLYFTWTLLLLCVGSIWVQNSIIAAYMLMGGVAASRLGLWMFDLAVIQQMQDKVSESDRCVAGGAQSSLQSTLHVMAYGMGIIISNPQDFWKLILLSFLFTTLSASLYTFHVYHVRKHPIHFEKLILLRSWSIVRSPDTHQSQNV